MDRRLPEPNYVTETEWRWPWYKFKMYPEALFTTLHERFNTHTLALQEPAAFLADVRETANNSATRDEFYAALQERRDQRKEELKEAWLDTATCIISNPIGMDCACRSQKSPADDFSHIDFERWGAFVDLAKSMSFDMLVCFFDGYARDERKRQLAKEEAMRWEPEPKPKPTRRLHDKAAARDAPTPAASSIERLPPPLESIGEKQEKSDNQVKGLKRMASDVSEDPDEGAHTDTLQSKEPGEAMRKRVKTDIDHNSAKMDSNSPNNEPQERTTEPRSEHECRSLTEQIETTK
ncbi:hypothetical protein F4808DRAFT_338388 [Astrocystis sublimbata]|nr:hypothetical protein F4808DRAFT_338388 [Astrocystis sublimbata]